MEPVKHEPVKAGEPVVVETPEEKERKKQEKRTKDREPVRKLAEAAQKAQLDLEHKFLKEDQDEQKARTEQARKEAEQK